MSEKCWRREDSGMADIKWSLLTHIASALSLNRKGFLTLLLVFYIPRLFPSPGGPECWLDKKCWRSPWRKSTWPLISCWTTEARRGWDAEHDQYLNTEGVTEGSELMHTADKVGPLNKKNVHFSQQPSPNPFFLCRKDTFSPLKARWETRKRHNNVISFL